MTLFAILAIMAVTAIMVLSAAPLVQQEVQRELELESIRRGEEVADAIKEYIKAHNGKEPESIDDLLEGLPQGTKKRMILRPSAAVDPLSEDGKWGLVKPEPQTLARFAQRVQTYNGGMLPGNPEPRQIFNRYSVMIVNSLNTADESDITEPDESVDAVTSDQAFIGVVSQSKSRSVLAYYGAENHSKWIFTPLFRGGGGGVPPPPGPGPNGRPPGGVPIRRPIQR